MAREAGEMHFADLQASRRGLAWRGQPFPEDLDARAFDTKVKMTKLAVRVRDNDIRALLKVLSGECDRIVYATSEAASKQILDQLINTHERVNSLMGVAILSLEDSHIAD
jgi:hypothetical protein